MKGLYKDDKQDSGHYESLLWGLIRSCPLCCANTCSESALKCMFLEDTLFHESHIGNVSYQDNKRPFRHTEDRILHLLSMF